MIGKKRKIENRSEQVFMSAKRRHATYTGR